MSIEYHYAALPMDDDLVERAMLDERVAETALFFLLLSGDAANFEEMATHHAKIWDPRYGMAADFSRRNADSSKLRFYGGKLFPANYAATIYYGAGNESLSEYRDEGFRRSIEYSFAMCDRPLNEAFQSYIGGAIRFSLPQVVLDVARNFPATSLCAIGDSYREQHCRSLLALYQNVARRGRFGLFLLCN